MYTNYGVEPQSRKKERQNYSNSCGMRKGAWQILKKLNGVAQNVGKRSRLVTVYEVTFNGLYSSEKIDAMKKAKKLPKIYIYNIFVEKLCPLCCSEEKYRHLILLSLQYMVERVKHRMNHLGL